MKKVLFCAAFVAALSMAFVACGKKDNKAAEGEEAALVLDNEEGEEAVLDNEEGEEAAPAACCDLNALVDKFCAACDADDEAAASKYGMELQKHAAELTQEQAMRMAAAGQAFAERHGYTK